MLCIFFWYANFCHLICCFVLLNYKSKLGEMLATLKSIIAILVWNIDYCLSCSKLIKMAQHFVLSIFWFIIGSAFTKLPGFYYMTQSVCANGLKKQAFRSNVHLPFLITVTLLVNFLRWEIVFEYQLKYTCTLYTIGILLHVYTESYLKNIYSKTCF